MFVLVFNCTKKTENRNKMNISIKKIDSLYTLDKKYPLNDVRRYGVFPNRIIGKHPILKKDKLEVLLDLAEGGQELFFPEGNYSRTLAIENRENLKLHFNKALFTGSVILKNSNNINLFGNLTSLIQLYTRDSKNIKIDQITLASDTIQSSHGKRNLGCSIHSGTQKLNIKKITVKSVSSHKKFKNIKGAFIVHGHNNEPTDITVDSLIINASDRHGIYLTGEEIKINFVKIDSFGTGLSTGMTPMEGGIDGEQSLFSGLWIKNAHNSYIKKAIINIQKSKGTYITNFDIGDSYWPFTIDTLIIIGKNPKLKRRKIEYTGVKVNKTVIE
jgi:hypothetical protein